jgi:hypothetical protein
LSITAPPHTSERAVDVLATSLAAGMDWPTALVEAMAVWPSPREVHRGRERNYFIAGEAFDWLALAERLLDTIRRQVPKDEREDLLFHGQFPPPFDMDRFKDVIGVDKYRGYLNYYYGVTVEEALQLAVELEVMKQYTSNGLHYKDEAAEVAFRRIYRLSRDELLAEFREGNGLTMRRSIDMAESKEFTYWLFKRRIRKWHPARVASDTRRGLVRLRELRDDENAADTGHLIINDIDLPALQATK